MAAAIPPKVSKWFDVLVSVAAAVVIWGALHGLYLIFSIITKKWRSAFSELSGLSKVPWLFQILQILQTFFLKQRYLLSFKYL